MSIRDALSTAAEQAARTLTLHRSQLRKGVRWEASAGGRSLGICTVYTDGEIEGWTVDGTSHGSLRTWLDAADVLAHPRGK